MVENDWEDAGSLSQSSMHTSWEDTSWEDTSWEKLLRQHGGKIEGYLRRRFPSFDDEARHDVLVDALVLFQRTFDAERGEPGPWLLLLAHQQAISRLRTDQRRVAPWALIGDAEAIESSNDGAMLSIDRAETVERVREAVDRLAPMERAVIEADLDVDGTVNAQWLAEQLETTPRAVYAARARAREKLARVLQPWFDSTTD